MQTLCQSGPLYDAEVTVAARGRSLRDRQLSTP
jgi:hypothetical protein